MHLEDGWDRVTSICYRRLEWGDSRVAIRLAAGEGERKEKSIDCEGYRREGDDANSDGPDERSIDEVEAGGEIRLERWEDERDAQEESYGECDGDF